MGPSSKRRMTCIVLHDFLYDELEFQLANSRKKGIYERDRRRSRHSAAGKSPNPLLNKTYGQDLGGVDSYRALRETHAEQSLKSLQARKPLLLLDCTDFTL